MSLIQNLYFAVFVFAIIVLFDLIIKFKSSFVLKAHFAILALTTASGALMHYLGANQFAFFIVLFKVINAAVFFNISCILYFPKIRKLIFTLGAAMIGAIIAFALYHIYVLKNYGNYYLNTQNLILIKGQEHLGTPLAFLFLRYSLLIIFIIVTIYYSYQIFFKIKQSNIYFQKIQKWTLAILILSIIFSFHNIPFSVYNTFPPLGHYMTLFIYFFVLFIIFYRPVFINKAGENMSFGSLFNSKEDYQVGEIDFNNQFFAKLYYKNPDASLENLAKELNIPSAELYRYIYNKYSMTFTDLVNMYRINYFLDIVQDARYANFTIDALAKEVGFSSRQHLYKPFKKFHGGNPSDIIEAINN